MSTDQLIVAVLFKVTEESLLSSQFWLIFADFLCLLFVSLLSTFHIVHTQQVWYPFFQHRLNYKTKYKATRNPKYNKNGKGFSDNHWEYFYRTLQGCFTIHTEIQHKNVGNTTILQWFYPNLFCIFLIEGMCDGEGVGCLA